MGKIEQVEEREVLDNISDAEYRISIVIDVLESAKFILQVRYPLAYPEEPPILDILAPQNAPKQSLFSVAADKQELLDGLSVVVEENLGMAMVFALVSTLKENTEDLILKRQASVREQREQEILAVEAEENKKFHGASVTPESFMKWREGFRDEMRALKIRSEEAEEASEKKKNRGKESLVQLTGRQLWESGLASKVEEDDDNDNDELLSPEIGKLSVAT